MRHLSALPLDDDIVDRILTFSQNFATLQATILVSKAFHQVFQTHPKSITRAVAYNVVGPALPQALRVIRYPYPHLQGAPQDGDVPLFLPDDDEDSDAGSDGPSDEDKPKEKLMDPIEMAMACPEDHAVTVITAAEKNQLLDLAEVVGKLEDIYSLTTKDRTSKTSVLTAEESGRFRSAAYRIILYCKLFSVEHLESDEIEDLDADACMKIYQQRTAVLNQYPTDELLEIFTLVKFMRGIFAEVADDQPNIQEILLSTGPAGAVRIWEDRSYDGVEDDLLPSGLLYGDVDFPLFDRFFSRAFENIWAARRLKPPSGDGGSAQSTTSSSASDSTSPAAMWLKYVEDQPTSKWILDSVIGGNDTCSQCATPGGLNLLTQANWSRLMMNPQPLLKGKLKDNRHTCNQFSGAWVARMNNSNTGAWIEELFGMSSASAVVNVVGSAGGAGTSTSGGASTSTSSGAASAPVGGTSATANSSTSTLAPAAAPAPTLAPATLKALAHSSFAPFAGWEVDMSYCESCLCRFIEQHTWVWWLEQELKSGWTPPEDCWYGYNCNTQTHRPLHAQGKNHMCVPTRGPA